MKIGKTTLVVTGSSGFVGEKLALVAICEGYEVIGIDFKKSSKLSCLQLELDLTSEQKENLKNKEQELKNKHLLEQENLDKYKATSLIMTEKT